MSKTGLVSSAVVKCVKENEDKNVNVNSSSPCKNREETISCLASLLSSQRPSLCNCFGPGPLLVSDLPPCDDGNGKREGGVVLGIDEAGRGPVLGPMVYAAAYWHPCDLDSIPPGLHDSKTLTAANRSLLFSKIQSTPEMGFVLRILHASEISRNMLRKQPYNLNAMSHDAAIQMIRAVLDAGMTIDTCFIDTVGAPQTYKRKLENEFMGHDITFVVETKADAKYASCSAASVIAKVSRDAILESWKWSEPNFDPKDGKDYGSGYPSDPKTNEWLRKNLTNSLFCYPDLVRFSWAPVKAAMNDGNGIIKVEWDTDDEDDDEGNGDGKQTRMSSFLINKVKNGRHSALSPDKKRPRLEYFERLGLSAITKID